MVLRKQFAIACTILLVATSASFGQQGDGRGNQNQPRQGGGRRAIPSVGDLVKQLDKNRDGKVTKNEVSETPFSRAFPRWDDDKDGTVTEAEIGKFRRARGIPIEGTGAAPDRPQQRDDNTVAKLTIPNVDDLLRVVDLLEFRL